MSDTSAPATRCGARTRSGAPCRHPLGKNTDHLGQGRCWLHGGKTPIRHGRYSAIERTRVGELAEQFEKDPDPLNLLPELAQARAVYQDYLERFDAFQRALFDWHESYTQGSQEISRKPRQVLDPADAMKLLSEVTRIAKRIRDFEAAEHVSRADFFRVMSELGRVVELMARRHIADTAVRERFLKAVVEGGHEIRLT